MFLIGVGAQSPVLLFDPQDVEAVRRFVGRDGRPIECCVASGTPAAARQVLESAAGAACTVVDDYASLARRLWPQATAAVIVTQTDYPGLLRAAAFAGAANAALVPVANGAAALATALAGWKLDTVYVMPGATAPTLPKTHVITFETADAVQRDTLRHLGETSPAVVVVANPHDRQGLFSPSSLSLLSPLIATTHRAPLVLVDDAAAVAVEAAVQGFITAHRLTPNAIYLVGDELALRSHRVPDPVLEGGGPVALGGARDVRVELFSELQHGRPQDYAVGRFVAADAALGSATLARQLHAGFGRGERVVLLSNADDQFALGETISRTTASELRNAGVRVRARYREAVTPQAIQEALEQAGVLVWEGHARDLTLEERGGISVQRTPPLVILQGCYTLDRSDPYILFERGTQAIVATSAAIYSASGSAFARVLLDALLYDSADLGTAVRNARNYLLGVTELKKRRGHSDWTKTYRAALAFALWGDPSARPGLAAQTPKLAPTEWRVNDAALELTIPSRRLERAAVGRYAAEPAPRAMLSGLILREDGRRQRLVKELFFDAFPAPAGITEVCPAGPGWDVVSFYAPNTKTLSVIARPPGPGNPSGSFRLPLAASPTGCADAGTNSLDSGDDRDG